MYVSKKLLNYSFRLYEIWWYRHIYLYMSKTKRRINHSQSCFIFNVLVLIVFNFSGYNWIERHLRKYRHSILSVVREASPTLPGIFWIVRQASLVHVCLSWSHHTKDPDLTYLCFLAFVFAWVNVAVYYY